MFQNKYSEEWLRLRYRPIAGADGEEDENDPATGGEEESSEETDFESEGNSEGGDAEDEDQGGDPNDADADELARVRAERTELQQKLVAAEAAARKAKAEEKKAREAAAKQDGNWEQIAKERESELADANERATRAETEAYEAKSELDAFKREVRVTRIATRLFFRDPKDAIDKLKDQPENTGDDKSCERALRKLAEEKPYLVDQKRARGRAMAGQGGNGGVLTQEQLRNMTPEEINQHWDRVSGSLTRIGPGGG